MHILVSVSAILASPISALCDEQLVPLAMSGNWAAFEHRDSMTSAPDVCYAGSITDHLGFRADTNGTSIRLSNERWSLPAEVTGSLRIEVGSYSKSFDIASNTDTMIDATVSREDMISLLAATDHATSLVLTVGKEKPKKVSLSGSSRVMNAFRTCADLSGNDKQGGENPFQ